MSSRRFLLLLAAAVLAMVGAFWMSAQRHLVRASLAGDLILPALKPALNEISRIKLQRADGLVVNLVREPAGWSVEERHYPADPGRVRKLLLDLAALAVVEEKTHDPRNYPQLGVEDLSTPNASGIRLELSAAQPLASLIVGKPSGTKAVFVRQPGAEASFLAAPQIVLDVAPSAWLDRTLLDVKPDRVRDVSITLPAAAPYTVSRSAPGDAEFTLASMPEGRTLMSPSEPSAAASALAGLTIDDVQPAAAEVPDAGPKASPEPKYRAVVRSFDGLVVELAGRKAGASDYVRVSARFDPSLRASGASSLRPSEAVEDEARAIEARAAQREFQLAAFRFEGIFRPLDSMLTPLPAQKSPFNASVRPAPR